MKKLLISLFLLVGSFLANDVSAQMINCGDFYTPWQYHCRDPRAPRYNSQNILNGYNGGYNGYNGGGYGGGSVSIWSSEYSNGQYNGGQYGNRPYPAGGYNGGYQGGGYEVITRTRPCTPQEERQRMDGNTVLGALGGAVGGAAFGHNRNDVGRWAAGGAILSAIYSGVTSCEITEQVRVPVARQSGSYQQSSAVAREHPSRCVVNGKVRKGLTEEECDELALSLSKTKIVNTEKVSANNTEIKTERATETSTTKNGSAGKVLVRMVEDIEPLKIKKGDEKCVSSQYKDDKHHVVVK